MRLKDSEARPFGSNSQWGEEAGDGTKVVTQFQGLCLWPYGVVSSDTALPTCTSPHHQVSKQGPEMH